MMEPIKINYINLRDKAASCIEGDKCQLLDFGSKYHEECLAERWEIVKDLLMKEDNKNLAEATVIVAQIRAFYTLGENDIWITFYESKLYWCHAEEKVLVCANSLVRRVIGTWCCESKSGEILSLESLDAEVLNVLEYKDSICWAHGHKSLLQKVKGI